MFYCIFSDQRFGDNLIVMIGDFVFIYQELRKNIF